MLILLVHGIGHAAVLRIPSQFPSIQTAIDTCASGDTLWLAPGTYFERLVVPDKSLTLCSDDFFTGDSTAVNMTVIDGEWLGTLIVVRSLASNVLTIDGLTLQRGLGEPSPAVNSAGGIQLDYLANLTVRNSIFRENRAHNQGAIISHNWLTHYPGRVVLSNLHLFPDRLTDENGVHYQIRVSNCQFLCIDRLRADPSPQPVRLISATADTIQVSDLIVDGGYGDGGYISIHGHAAYDVHDVSVRNVSVEDGPALVLSLDNGSPPYLMTARDILVEDCHSNQPLGGSGVNKDVIDISSDDSLLASRITIRNCTTNAGRIVTIKGYGLVRNLLVEGCVSGADPEGFESNSATNTMGRVLYTVGCSTEDVVVQDNISRIYPYYQNGLPITVEVQGLAWEAGGTFNLIGRNRTHRRTIIQNNLSDDHEDNWDTRIQHPANLGRALVTGAAYHWPTQEVLFEDLIVRNNRQPNSVPERPSDDPAVDPRMVGSTVQFYNTTGPADWYYPKMVLHNVLIEDNDDGGLSNAPSFRYYEVHNLVSRNNGRMGLFFRADTLDLQNILVEGTDSLDAYFTYPYDLSHQTWQTAFAISGGEASQISNVTLTDNSTVCLFAGLNVDFPRMKIHNSIIWGNPCHWFTHPGLDITQWLPPEFEYCLLDNPQPGIGNLIGVDPLFDAELGAPWLSPASPAIDAGSPAPQYHDAEDPLHPGQARWPSQGGLRNDMGYTGGPGAFAIDTSWVALQRPTPRPSNLPQGLKLGLPYPNPFNPMTRIPFTLDRPLRVTISVYNLRGQRIQTLLDESRGRGEHEIVFQAIGLSSGVYLIELTAGGKRQTRKVLLLQ
ncbi:MAG: T9SS type A sorting domain-containing protein [Candidatus Delongbacteria bacterium]|nr:T9SS type A sorting domain-containing protein [Candidatus Delongbacteria bacterium]